MTVQRPPGTVEYRYAPLAFWPIRWLIAAGLIIVGFLGILGVLSGADKLVFGCILATGIALIV